MPNANDKTGKRLTKTQKKRIASGNGVGKITRKDEGQVFMEFLKDSRCTTCDQVFSYLEEFTDKKYCMNCFNQIEGSTSTMKVCSTLSHAEQMGWENSISDDRCREMFYERLHGNEKIDNVIREFISMGVDTYIQNKSRTMCEEKECSGEMPRALPLLNEQIKEEMVDCTNALLHAPFGNDSLFKDSGFRDFISTRVNEQINGLNSSGFSYLKYLLALFNHFKHATVTSITAGTFDSSKVYDFGKSELVKCIYEKKDLEESDSTTMLKYCKIILSDDRYYLGNQYEEINSFKLDYDNGIDENNIVNVLINFHNETKHEEIAYLDDEKMKFIKDNGYDEDWDNLEKNGLELVYCDQCRILFVEKVDPNEKEPYPKQYDKVVESTITEEDFLNGDIEQEQKIEKILKQKPKFLLLDEAVKKLVRLDIKSQGKLDRAKKKGHCKDIPAKPVNYYNGLFKWKDVQSKRTFKHDITYSKVEQAIRMLKSNWKFYMRKPEGFFYDWFDSWGLFEAQDPFKQRFFTEFINLKQTVEGRRELFEAISSGRFDMKSGHYPKQPPTSTPMKKVQFASDVTNVVDELKFEKLLEDDKEAGVHLILQETDSLLPMDKDSRAFKLHVSIIVQELWIAVLKVGESEKDKVQKWKSQSKSVLGATVISTFLAEYSLVGVLKNEVMSSDYRGHNPNVMQMYVAFMLSSKNGYGNFSSTGVGKTSSATISSRVTNSKNTLVLCPKPIMNQWGEMILADYPLSYVSLSNKKGDAVFPDVGDKNAFRYHVVNYQKFGRLDTVDLLIDAICETRVDMVIVDEAQWVKQRDENVSNTRQSLERLLVRLRERKPNLKVLFLTATPVINNLTEGVRLIEMIANKKYPHLKTSNQIRNASRLYMEMLSYSLRFKKDYKINTINKQITTQSYIPITKSAEEIRKFNYSDWEILCTPDRIPEMLEIVKREGKAIIYTEYVSIVVDQIKKAFTEAGYRVGTFTGQKDGKEGLVKKTGEKGVYTNPFQNGDIDVLIASSPIAEGIDGLQNVCNTLIFNGLTWTYAKYEQIIGRLVRTGQTKDVNVYTILSRVENYDFDKKIKLDRLYQKEMLQMCVLDGKIPDINKWKKGTKHFYKDFVETVLRDQKSRIESKKQLRDAGVTEA